MPVVSTMIRSNRSFRFWSFLNISIKSPRTVQHTHPFAISNTTSLSLSCTKSRTLGQLLPRITGLGKCFHLRGVFPLMWLVRPGKNKPENRPKFQRTPNKTYDTYVCIAGLDQWVIHPHLTKFCQADKWSRTMMQWMVMEHWQLSTIFIEKANNKASMTRIPFSTMAIFLPWFSLRM